MEWHIQGLLVISLLFVLSEAKNKKHENTCKHGGYLKNVNFEGGKHSNNYTLLGRVRSMKDCVRKCCHTKHCDLAMLQKDHQCFSLNCNKDESCHIIHMKSGSRDSSVIAFITKSSVNEQDGKKRKHKTKKSKTKKKLLQKKRRKLKHAAKQTSQFPRVTHQNMTNDDQYDMLRHNQTLHDVEDDEEEQNGRQYAYVDQQIYSRTNGDNNTDPNNYNITKENAEHNKILSNNNKTLTDINKVVKTNNMRKVNKDKNGNGMEEYSTNFETKTESHSNTKDPDNGAYHYSSTYNYDSRNGKEGGEHNGGGFGFPNGIPGGFQYPGLGKIPDGNNYKFPGAHLPIPQGPNFDYEGDISSYNPYHYVNKEDEHITTNDLNSLKEKTTSNNDVTESTKNETANKNNNTIEQPTIKYVPPTTTKTTTKTSKKPTKDEFVTEIAGELDSSQGENDEDDISSGAEVEIAEDGTLMASVENTTATNQTYNMLNSTKYQPVQSMTTNRYDESSLTNQTITNDVNHYDMQQSPSKYYNDVTNNTNITSPWQQNFNNTQQKQGSFGDVGDMEVAPLAYNSGDNQLQQNISSQSSTGAYETFNKQITNGNQQQQMTSSLPTITMYNNYNTTDLTQNVETKQNESSDKQNTYVNTYTNENDNNGSPTSYNYNWNNYYGTAQTNNSYWKNITTNTSQGNKQNDTTIGESLFPTQKQNNNDVQEIQEELTSGSAENDDDEDDDEDEKEEKITKSIQSSYDAFSNESKVKNIMPKDTAVLLIAEELESGSGSAENDDVDDNSNMFSEEMEENTTKEKLHYDEESEDNVPLSLYNTPPEWRSSQSSQPVLEWQSSQGSKTINKTITPQYKSYTKQHSKNMSTSISYTQQSQIVSQQNQNVPQFPDYDNSTTASFNRKQQHDESSGEEEDDDEEDDEVQQKRKEPKFEDMMATVFPKKENKPMVAKPKAKQEYQTKVHQPNKQTSSQYKEKKPTLRPQQLAKPGQTWSSIYTQKPNYSYERNEEDSVNDTVEEGENDNTSTDERSTRRSTIWKQKHSNKTMKPTSKHTKIPALKAEEVDKKPPKKSFLPFTNDLESPMNTFEDGNDGWLQQNLLQKNAFEPQNIDNFEQSRMFNDQQSYATYDQPLIQKHKHKHHKRRHGVATPHQDNDGDMLIPIGKLPSKKHHHHHHHHHRRGKVHHQQHQKHHHPVMINTGIKASSFLGKMLTNGDDPSPELNDGNDLTAFATQMALTGNHQKKHHHPYVEDDQSIFDTNPLGYNGLPVDTNYAYKNEKQSPEVTFNSFQQPSEQVNDYLSKEQQPQVNVEQVEQPTNTIEQQQEAETNVGLQETNSQIIPQQNKFVENQERGMGAIENQVGGMDTVENQAVGNPGAVENQVVGMGAVENQAGNLGATETNVQQSTATLGVLNNINGHDHSEADKLAMRFNNDLTGLGEEMSKIPGIAQITGIQTGRGVGSSPEVFSQRHMVADNQQNAYMARFNNFKNFQNFGTAPKSWLNFRETQRPLMNMGKKKDELLNPANLTETYFKDEKHKEGLLNTRFFMHEPETSGKYSWNNNGESALKINITDNPDDTIESLTDDVMNEKNNTTTTEQQNKTISNYVSQENTTLNEIHTLNTTVPNISNLTESSKSSNESKNEAPLYQRMIDTKEENSSKNEGDHISWKTKTGKGVQPEDDNGTNSYSKENKSLLNKSYDDINSKVNTTTNLVNTTENKTLQSNENSPLESTMKSSQTGEKMNSKLSDKEETNWKEVVMDTQHAKQIKDDKTHEPLHHAPLSSSASSSSLSSSSSSSSSADHTMKKLTQELRRRTKPLLPSHQFFHALKEALVSKLHSLNNHGEVMLNRDEPSLLLATITQENNNEGETRTIKIQKKKKKNERKKKKKVFKFETKQSKIVKDGPSKDASLLNINVKRKDKKRKAKNNKYKEKKKRKVKKAKQTLDYNTNDIPLKIATHKKEKQKNKNKSIHYNGKHKQNKYIPSSEDSLFDITPEEIQETASNEAMQRDDYDHGHPMGGHRYGDANYQSTHKWANHDYSKQQGHYGMHNDTADNHDNSDPWANKDPNKTNNVADQQTTKLNTQHVNQLLETPAQLLPQETQQQQIPQYHAQESQQQIPQYPAAEIQQQIPQYPAEESQQQREELTQQQFPSQQATHGMEKEKEITDKLNTFNLLANSLTSKLNDLNAVNGMKAITGSDWRSFINYQKRLDSIKQARQEVLDHFINKDPTCNRGLTVRGATLRGGVLSGEFKSMGVVDTQKQCVDQCCQSKRGCDVAMTIGRECINIKCFNRKQCTIAPAGNLKIYNHVLPVVTFVRKQKHLTKRSQITHPLTFNEAVNQLDDDERRELKTMLNNNV